MRFKMTALLLWALIYTVASYSQELNFPVNLAEGQPVVSSSAENDTNQASNIADGDLSTRWSSEYHDDEFIYVELDQVYLVSSIMLYWEAAYGEHYKIQVSLDGNNWADVYEEQTGDGADDYITIEPSNAKYVRMQGIKRGTHWGYSLFEFEIYAGCYANAGRDISLTDWDGSGAEEITLKGIGSAESDSSYKWSWGTNEKEGRQVNASFTEGEESVILAVTSGETTCHDLVRVNILPKSNELPVAKGMSSIEVEVGNSIEFSDLGSYDPDGSIVSRRWKIAQVVNENIRSVNALDEAASMNFAIMSDHWGRSPYTSWSDSVYMARMDRWVKEANSKFVLGVGDHMQHAGDTWDQFVAHPRDGGDSYWHYNFYPATADHDNEAYTGRQDAWGASEKSMEILEMKERSNVHFVHNEPNKLDYGVEYYAWMEHNGLKVHWVALHFPDEYDGSQGGNSGFLEPSRQWMMNIVDSLYQHKTKNDIIIVGAHSWNGNFVELLSPERRIKLLKQADLILSATMHQYRRFSYLDLEDPPANVNNTILYPTDAITDGALVLNTGAVLTGPIFGYLTVNIFKNPTRLVLQYQDTHQESRSLIKSHHDYTYSSGNHLTKNYSWLKYIGGPTIPINNWEELRVPLFEPLATDINSVTHAFNNPGDYLVRLIVTDDRGGEDIFDTEVIVKPLDNSNVPVEQIRVEGTLNKSIINRQDWPLQLRAIVGPYNASNKEVKWQMQSLGGEATISDRGILRPIKNGQVLLQAEALDGSEVKGELVVTITNQKEQQVVTGFQIRDDLPSIFPNPGTGKIQFAGIEGIKRIFVTDTLGKKIALIEGSSLHTLDVAPLPEGIYIIRVFAEHHEVYTFKFRKE